MLRRLIAYLFIYSLTFSIVGCSFFRYPAVEKTLFAWKIEKRKVPELKNIILTEGYEKITKDDYYYQGAFVTQFEKTVLTVPTIKDNSNVLVMLNFKNNQTGGQFYGNLGITITNLYHDVPEIRSEIERLESLLYKTLVDYAGTENVVRGNRK